MKILALDGGGVFGDIQSKILKEADCFDKFDCFVGTSIGSALSAAIALGIEDRISPDFFHQWMPEVFKTSWFRKYNIFNSKYPDKGLNEALRTAFGNNTLGDAKKPLFITAANVGGRTLKVFNFSEFSDATWPMWEVVRCATAAETYFSSWKGYADGGVFANNPSMVAVASVSRILKVPVSEMEILSIGTGISGGNGKKQPTSDLQWGVWLVNALLEGASDKMHEYFVRSLPLKKNERIQFIRKPDWAMDNPACMYKAEELWADDIEKAVKIVRAF